MKNCAGSAADLRIKIMNISLHYQVRKSIDDYYVSANLAYLSHRVIIVAVIMRLDVICLGMFPRESSYLIQHESKHLKVLYLSLRRTLLPSGAATYVVISHHILFCYSV